MATRPELHIAVAKTKSKASEYNDNFDMMMDFVDDSIQESKDYVDGFMPNVTGNSGKLLTNNGTTTSWFNLLGANNTFTGSNTFSGSTTMSGGVTISGSSFTFTRCTTQPTTTSTASNSKVAVVVKNYKNGTSWYRVWSDGFIEQGGISDTPNDGTNTVNLLKNFTGTDYSVQLTILTSSGTGLYNASLTGKTKSTIKIYVGSVYDCMWYAYGY